MGDGTHRLREAWISTRTAVGLAVRPASIAEFWYCTSEFGRVWYAVTAVGTKKNCAFSVPRVPDHTPERRLMAESNTVDAALRVVFPSLEDRYASQKVTVS